MREDNMPCHLRDNTWLAKLMITKMEEEHNVQPENTFAVAKLTEYLRKSEKFQDLRHEYELRIVNWQIDWMRGGGEHWLLPDGYDEFDIIFGDEPDFVFRAGLVKTLKRIGMDKEVIEEGLEKYADKWRRGYMERSFFNQFDGTMQFEYLVNSLFSRKNKPLMSKYSEEHKENFLKLREYDYYIDHRESVDKYGKKTEAMYMTSEEASKLREIVKLQNAERAGEIERYKNMCNNINMEGVDPIDCIVDRLSK